MRRKPETRVEREERWIRLLFDKFAGGKKVRERINKLIFCNLQRISANGRRNFFSYWNKCVTTGAIKREASIFSPSSWKTALGIKGGFPSEA